MNDEERARKIHFHFSSRSCATGEIDGYCLDDMARCYCLDEIKEILAALAAVRAEEREACEAMLRAEADKLPDSYKRSKQKILGVADAMRVMGL